MFMLTLVIIGQQNNIKPLTVNDAEMAGINIEH